MRSNSLKALIVPAFLALATFGVGPAPALAHHSFNAYDISKVMTATGTLKEFRWGAPHSSMVLTYKDASGKPAEMILVSGSPLAFSKQGMAPRDFHPGDKVTITYHPNTNGAPGGVLATLSLPNGKKYSDAEAAAAGPGGPPPPGAPVAPSANK